MFPNRQIFLDHFPLPRSWRLIPVYLRHSLPAVKENGQERSDGSGTSQDDPIRRWQGPLGKAHSRGAKCPGAQDNAIDISDIELAGFSCTVVLSSNRVSRR